MMAANSRDESPPSISIVIPVLNEARDIGRLLDEVMGQTPPRGGFEVLVVDGGSTDKTKEIVAGFSDKWPNLRWLTNPRKLSSAGRNTGAQAARGKYVVFLDGHCAIPRNDYLVRTLELFETTGAACLCRPQSLLGLTDGPWERAISAARHSWFGHNWASDIYADSPAFTNPLSAGAAYSRSLIADLGGYDERFDACEDVEFNYRVAKAGKLSYRHPDLRVDYRPRSSLKSLFGQMARYGRGRARVMARHPGVFPWPLILISSIVIAIPLTLIFAGTRPAILMTGILLGSWIALILAESIRLAGLRPGALRIALVFLVIYAGLSCGFWRGIPELGRFRSPAST